MAGAFLRGLLADRGTEGMSLDDPATTEHRRSIIHRKPALRAIYRDWYAEILQRLPPRAHRVLELGAGAGFLRSAASHVFTSDILRLKDIDLVADATRLPLTNASLDALVMVNVFHHLANASLFLHEATRCIVPDGKICMIEPWVSWWSRRVYTLHSEPFDPDRKDWLIPSGGPLTGANGALPWIIFRRDRAKFEADFPSWELEEVRPIMPFRYLLSGGVSMRQLAPAWAFAGLARLERALDPFRDRLGMFALIVLRRRHQENERR